MTAKRKRRRGSSRGPGARGSKAATSPQKQPDEAVEAESGSPQSGAAAAADRPRQRGAGAARRGLASIPSPYPPFTESVGAGLRAVGASVQILAVAFLGELALWGIFEALGAPVLAYHMAGLMGLPPIHVLFDVQLVQAIAEETVQLVLLALGAVAVRSALFGLLAVMIVDAVRGGSPSVRSAVRRLPAMWAGLVQYYVIEVFLVLAVPTVLGLVLGPQFGQLGVVVALVVGLHFLVMAPVIMAAEGAPAPEAMRRSVRAARLPGLRHLGLVLTYFFLAMQVLIPISSVGIRPATPSIGVWALALGATLVHMAVLGAFAYRWLAVREEPAVASGQAARRGGAASAARKGSAGTSAARKQGSSPASKRRSGRGG